MGTKEKNIVFQSKNSYSTLNQLSSKTKNVWLVMHGIGYLSRYFLKYFSELSKDENYIIAPQAPSKYYLNGAYKHVGASWLTKENTDQEIENVMSYINGVFEAEKIPKNVRFIVFGYSQGVSVASRWVARNKIKCNDLVLYAGGIPNELKVEDFNFLGENNTKITMIIGDNDPYINKKRLQIEQDKTENLFNGTAKFISFTGGHEVKKELINALL